MNNCAHKMCTTTIRSVVENAYADAYFLTTYCTNWAAATLARFRRCCTVLRCLGPPNDPPLFVLCAWIFCLISYYIETAFEGFRCITVSILFSANKRVNDRSFKLVKANSKLIIAYHLAADISSLLILALV